MFTRLLLKMAFKACVPLVAVGGVMSYMFYLQGGDPGAVFSKVVGGLSGQARDSVAQAGKSLDSVKSTGESSISEVHTWVDANGVTHFSTNAPIDAQSKTLRVNANRNVVASVPKPTPKPKADTRSAQTSTSGSEPTGGGGLKGSKIPGTGGLEMPVNLNRQELTEFLENAQRPSIERMGLE